MLAQYLHFFPILIWRTLLTSTQIPFIHPEVCENCVTEVYHYS